MLNGPLGCLLRVLPAAVNPPGNLPIQDLFFKHPYMLPAIVSPSFQIPNILNKWLPTVVPFPVCQYFLFEPIVNGLPRLTQGFSCARTADVEEWRSGRDKAQEERSRRGSWPGRANVSGF